MKYFIITMHMIVLAHSLGAMEDKSQSSQKYITFINDITDKTLPKKFTSDIYISDTYRIDIRKSFHVIFPAQGTKLESGKTINFTPATHRDKPEDKRLGMNNANTAALLAVYVSAATETGDQYFKLFIGENQVVQFGDKITFSHKVGDQYITMLHKNTIAREIPFEHVVTTYGAPKDCTNEPLLMVLSNTQK